MIELDKKFASFTIINLILTVLITSFWGLGAGIILLIAVLAGTNGLTHYNNQLIPMVLSYIIPIIIEAHSFYLSAKSLDNKYIAKINLAFMLVYFLANLAITIYVIHFFIVVYLINH